MKGRLDLVAVRALTAGLLAAFVAVVYVLVVVMGGRAVSGDDDRDVLALAATGLVAVGFHPVRRRLDVLASRVVHGDRTSAYDVLAGWAREDDDDALMRACRLLHQATGADVASVWRRDDDRAAATWPPLAAPSPRTSEHEFCVVSLVAHEGSPLGAVSISKPRSEPPSDGDRRLVDDLAHSLGVVLHNDRLMAELRRQVDDLEASRLRLVDAGDDARRAIERSLDAAALDRIAMVRVDLDRLRARADLPEDDRLVGLLDQLADETLEASRAVRAFAHGVYPALLAERGLAHAVSVQAARLDVDVTVTGDPGPLPADIESALYFVCLEALQNVAKYADASSVRVRFERHDATVAFEVADDGVGFDASTQAEGAGMGNMRDRIDALSGRLSVSSAPGGTTVRAEVAVPMAVSR